VQGLLGGHGQRRMLGSIGGFNTNFDANHVYRRPAMASATLPQCHGIAGIRALAGRPTNRCLTVSTP
jgi:hypothetical protein